MTAKHGARYADPMTPDQMIEAMGFVGRMPGWIYQKRRRELAAITCRPIIRPLDTFAFPQEVPNKRFRVADCFRLSITSVPFTYIDKSFLDIFGDMMVANLCIGELESFEIMQDTRDEGIYRDLPNDYLVHLGMVWNVLQCYHQNAPPFLSESGSDNIFYVPDGEGIVHSVSARWTSDGWGIWVYPFNSTHTWKVRGRIIAGNAV